MSQTLNVDKDAFSSGQIGSKLWLCEQIEDCFESVDIVWIYGGWYGITAFLLRSRNCIPIKQIRSIDVDPACEPVADMINENWVYQDWQFKAVTKDCNTLDPMGVDLVINSSTEHFTNLSWWHNIPQGTMVALQGADMPHDDHVYKFNNLTEFVNTFPLTTTMYTGAREFEYPTWKFTRFMVIGEK
jgi:hypothetical protein